MPKPNGPQFQRFYHGTDHHNVESILKEGLRVNNPAAGLYEEDSIDPGHPVGIYVTDTVDDALGYGSSVFSMNLPIKSKHWGWTESDGAVWTKSIHSSKIKQER